MSKEKAMSNKLLPRARRVPDVKRRGFEIFNSADTGVAQVHIYNEISRDGITADQFKNDFAQITAPSIELRLNSIGGDVFDGVAIYHTIRNHPSTVDVIVDGVAASIASVIAMAGDTVRMSRGSQLMMHDAWTAAVGNAKHMRDQAELLDRWSDTISAFYAEAAGSRKGPADPKHWRTCMEAETWYDATEAVKAGLADEVIAPARTVKAQWDLSVFNYAGRANAPTPLLAPPPAVKAATTKTSRPAGTTKTAANGDWAAIAGPLLNSPATGADELLARLWRA
jgi:ATP-dependent protease ClpP protease subunit